MAEMHRSGNQLIVEFKIYRGNLVGRRGSYLIMKESLMSEQHSKKQSMLGAGTEKTIPPARPVAATLRDFRDEFSTEKELSLFYEERLHKAKEQKVHPVS